MLSEMVIYKKYYWFWVGFSFAYFNLATQRKVRSPTGRNCCN